MSLCAFNLGVEIGQMMIVTLCYPLLVLLAGQPWRLRVVNTLSLVIGGLGSTGLSSGPFSRTLLLSLQRHQ